MDELFGKLEKISKVFGEKVGEKVEEVGKLAEDTIEVQKIKTQIHGLKRANERDLIDMGKFMYEKYKSGEVIDSELAAFCDEISNREEQIEEYSKEISRIKGE